MVIRESRIQTLLKSELLRNTSILISGTAAAQVIPIILQPVLRRYFSAEIFGAYSVYLSLLGILIIISSFKYELAIILPRKDSEAANVLFLTIILSLLFNIALLLAIIIWKPAILKFLNLGDKFGSYLYIVPLGTFLYSFYQAINYWLIRKKKFFPISLNKFVRRGFEGVSQLIFRFAKVSYGLILGDIIGNLANIISGAYQGLKSGLSLRLLSPGKIKNVIFKYSEYPKFNVIPSLMSACSFLLPAILVNKYFSSEYAGFLDLSKMILSIPLALVATSLSSVLLQRTSEKYRERKSIKHDLVTVLVLVLLIALAEIIVISLFGPGLFKFVFGNGWEYSGEISKVLVWSYALNFFVASFSFIFISMNKIKPLSIWQLVYFISILSLLFFKNNAFKDFIRIYVFIEVICYLIIILLMIYLIYVYERGLRIVTN
jgi:O-antigen/teichoic acid export membrane protein